MLSLLLLLLLLAVTLPFASTTRSTKRGLIYIPSSHHPTDDNIWEQADSDVTWYYNYNVEPTSAYLRSSMEFVPMLWGTTAQRTGTAFTDSVLNLIKGGTNLTHVLGFNEPDGDKPSGGSDIPVDIAAATWIREIEPLRKEGIKLGAPAVTGSQRGLDWLADFFKECDGSCTVDFMPLHWYGDFGGLASHIGQTRALYPNLTIWITEYADAHVSLEDSQRFYNMSAEYFDRLDYITRYSYFGAFRSDVSNIGPNAAFLTERGKLTDIGSWYLGHGATGNVPKGTATARASKTPVLAAWSILFALTLLTVS